MFTVLRCRWPTLGHCTCNQPVPIQQYCRCAWVIALVTDTRRWLMLMLILAESCSSPLMVPLLTPVALLQWTMGPCA